MLGRHRCVHRPANHTAGEEIDYGGHIEPALRRPHIREVSDPFAVGSGASKLRSSTLGATAATYRSPRSGGGRRRRAFKGLLPHQSFDPVQTAPHPFGEQIMPDTPGPCRFDRSPESWHEPSRQRPHRSGCVDFAAVSATHRSHPARHRAPRTTIPPARSPGASQRNRTLRRFLREAGRGFFRISRSAFSVATSRLSCAISKCSGFIWSWPVNACRGSSASCFPQLRNCVFKVF